MLTFEGCKNRAEECLLMARSSKGDSQRAKLLQIAEKWLILAEESTV